MIAVEQNQEDGDGGREKKQPILGENIRVQQTTTTACSNFILFILVGTVEGSEVNIGRSVIDVDIVVIGSEDAGNREELAGA